MEFRSVSFERIKFFIFYCALFFLISALSIQFNVLDYDLWARLIAGNAVSELSHPLYRDIFSYTNTHIWYDPEWLSSAFIYWIFKHFGVVGLTNLKAVLVFLMFFVISFALRRRNKIESAYNISYYILLALISLQAGLIVFTVRCQLITFILMGLWIFLLEEIRCGNDKFLVFLPFIMLFWLNAHGGAIAGVGILFLYGIGEFLNKQPFKKYFITLLFVCLVFFINPWGADYIKFIFDSAFLDRSWISEWQSPFGYFFRFNLAYKIFLFASLICYISKICIKKLKFCELDKTKLLILAVLAYLSVKYIKHLGLFVVIYSIFMYEDYYFIYNYLLEKIRTYFNLKKNFVFLRNFIIYFLIFSYSIWIFLKIPVSTSHYKGMFRNYPVFALQFLKVNEIKGNLFIPFYYASYAAYRYYPDIKIYMDGRQEQVYSSLLFDNHMFFLGKLGIEPNRAIKDYPPDIILVEKFWKCNDLLDKNEDFIRIYADKKFYIYVRKNLAKFNYNSPSKDIKYNMETLFSSNISFRGNDNENVNNNSDF